MRERIAKTLSERKTRLLKEKEHLDIADTNAILLHPSQFSITNPSSPGGAQGSRKTRHARNRLEDEYGSGLLVDAGIKRKRRLFEDNIGSPTRDGISTPAERKQARLLSQQAAPVISFASLFSDKDLKNATSEAYIATQHFFATSKKNGATVADAITNGKSASDGEASIVAGEDSTDDATTNHQEELAAPEMDRTASQQTYHATRSTRNAAGGNSGMAGMNILSDLAEKAATRPPVPYFLLGTYPTRSGAALPPPPALMAEEQDEDLHKIEEIIKKPKGWVDKKLLDELCAPIPEQKSRSLLDPRFPVYMNVHLVDATTAVPVAGRGTPAKG